MLGKSKPKIFFEMVGLDRDESQGIIRRKSPTKQIQDYLVLICCHGQKSRFIGDGIPPFNRNPCNGNMNPYCWVDDHPLLYGNNMK